MIPSCNERFQEVGIRVLPGCSRRFETATKRYHAATKLQPTFQRNFEPGNTKLQPKLPRVWDPGDTMLQPTLQEFGNRTTPSCSQRNQTATKRYQAATNTSNNLGTSDTKLQSALAKVWNLRDNRLQPTLPNCYQALPNCIQHF